MLLLHKRGSCRVWCWAETWRWRYQRRPALLQSTGKAQSFNHQHYSQRTGSIPVWVPGWDHMHLRYCFLFTWKWLCSVRESTDPCHDNPVAGQRKRNSLPSCVSHKLTYQFNIQRECGSSNGVYEDISVFNGDCYAWRKNLAPPLTVRLSRPPKLSLSLYTHKGMSHKENALASQSIGKKKRYKTKERNTGKTFCWAMMFPFQRRKNIQLAACKDFNTFPAEANPERAEMQPS